MSLSLAKLNSADQAAFTAHLGHLFEHSPWVAAETWSRRPFRDAEQLLSALGATVRAASRERQRELIRAHPDLAGRLARANALTTASTQEQASAGLHRLTADELREFQALNDAYRDRFGFPFVICARLNAKEAIVAAMRARLRHTAEEEHAAALAEIDQIARLRLHDTLGKPLP